MKMTFAGCVLIAVLLQIATAPVTGALATAPVQSVSASQAAAASKGGELAALEQKLLGTWHGPACIGTLTFNPDRSFERQHFTPGDNTVSGTWSLRWDALPPTLVLKCKTSNFKMKDASRADYAGTIEELKLVELSDEALAYRFPKAKGETLEPFFWQFSRRGEKD
jgi:hypothetical protein